MGSCSVAAALSIRGCCSILADPKSASTHASPLPSLYASPCGVSVCRTITFSGSAQGRQGVQGGGRGLPRCAFSGSSARHHALRSRWMMRRAWRWARALLSCPPMCCRRSSRVTASLCPAACSGASRYVRRHLGEEKEPCLSLRPAGSREASLSPRSCLRLPQVPASLGRSAAWAALAGHVGLTCASTSRKAAGRGR